MRKFLAFAAACVLGFSAFTGVGVKPAFAKGGAAGEIQFVELAPLILPILDKNGVHQSVSLVVTLEITNPDAYGTVDMLKPRIKDAFIQELYGTLHDHAASSSTGMLQVRTIKKKLTSIASKVVGKGAVNDVLLQVVQQRPV